VQLAQDAQDARDVSLLNRAKGHGGVTLACPSRRESPPRGLHRRVEKRIEEEAEADTNPRGMHGAHARSANPAVRTVSLMNFHSHSRAMAIARRRERDARERLGINRVRRAFAIEIARTTNRALGKNKNHPSFSSRRRAENWSGTDARAKHRGARRARNPLPLFFRSSLLRSLFGRSHRVISPPMLDASPRRGD